MDNSTFSKFKILNPSVVSFTRNLLSGYLISTTPSKSINADDDVVGCRDAINRVSTEKTGGITGKHNPMFHNNISRVLRWFKGRCTFEINKIYDNSHFAWQPRFHDRIIRDEHE